MMDSFTATKWYDIKLKLKWLFWYQWKYKIEGWRTKNYYSSLGYRRGKSGCWLDHDGRTCNIIPKSANTKWNGMSK